MTTETSREKDKEATILKSIFQKQRQSDSVHRCTTIAQERFRQKETTPDGFVGSHRNGSSWNGNYTGKYIGFFAYFI